MSLASIEAFSLELQEREGSSTHRSHSLTSPADALSVEDIPPTRGYQALLLFSGFMMIFHIIGINGVFGLFQDFYTSSESNIPSAIGNDAVVALVGTIGSGLTWSGGLFVNPIIARVEGVKLITFIGAAVMSLGLFLASYCSALWQLYLTQALLYGFGSSMYYFPIMTIAPTYFDRHRGFAMGFILSGAGIGGLVMAPVLQLLLDRYGIRSALRILAAWNFAVGVPVACAVRRRAGFGPTAHGTSTRVNMALVKRGTFLYQAMGAFLQAAGNVIPLYYMTSYSTSILSYSRSTGSLLLAINSAVNSVSRVAMGVLADGVGRQNTMTCAAFLSSLSVLALWYDAPRARYTTFVVMYGIYAGGYNALVPTTITEIYGVENYARVNGAIYFVRGLGSLLGAPVAGLILGSHTRGGTNAGVSGVLRRYEHVVLYDGLLLFCASACIAYVRWLDARDKGAWKWKA
ncbi:major facilitator superfamily domain-containing protein [Mycena maculata]|uniref:Major facilitator superfamily domain-containing protein n=1 Tax=Mycena maculata TaxID=230809 RepID=A0AAD7HZ70_9AGAR|nr:major facilitator superfamily domain-containing protein [Mycena maculata]